LLCIFITVFTSTSFAQNSQDPAGFVIEAKRTQSLLLELKINDAHEQKNSCDYFVKRFEYIEAIDTLRFEVVKNFCVVDRTGKSGVVFNWTMPRSLKYKNKIELNVLINSEPPQTITISEIENGNKK
jgi:hypothetical protein